MNVTTNTEDLNECDVFLEALEIDDPSKRHKFLTRKCRGNSEFQDRIEELLATSDGDTLNELTPDPSAVRIAWEQLKQNPSDLFS